MHTCIFCEHSTNNFIDTVPICLSCYQKFKLVLTAYSQGKTNLEIAYETMKLRGK